jgi:DNA-binding response OmpR family regulator
VPRRRPRGRPVDAPALTVTFEVTLSGQTRYADAAEVLDTLRRVTDRLGTARVEVAPASTASVGAEPSADVDSDAVLVLADSHVVRVGEREIPFTRVEFDLLLFLATHPRRVFTRAQLLQTVWGFAHAGQRTVDVHIRRLRAKLPGVCLVTTVRGVGYRLADHANVRVLRLP